MLTRHAFHVVVFVASLVAAQPDYDPLDDLAAYPAFLRGLRTYRQHVVNHHHRHFRAGRNHRHLASAKRSLALMHHLPAGMGVASPHMEWNPDGNQLEASVEASSDNEVREQVAAAINAPSNANNEAREREQVAAAITAPTMALPGRSPSVEKALDSMPSDLQALKAKDMAAKEARNQLEGKVGQAFSHMNDGVPLKQALRKKEAQLRMEDSKLKMLEGESENIENTRVGFIDNLHRVLEPKMMFAQQRLHKRERTLEEEERAATGWKEKRDQLKQSAVEFIKERHAAKDQLLEAEAQVAEAKRKEERAHRHFERERQSASREIQSYKYATTRFNAEVTHEKAANEAVLAAKQSVNKLDEVMELEGRKVEESMAAQKEKIQRRMQRVKAARRRSEKGLGKLEEQYKSWQESERDRAAEVIKKSQETVETSKAFGESERQVLESAEAQAAKDAESKSDWAWESDFSSGATDSSFSD